MNIKKDPGKRAVKNRTESDRTEAAVQQQRQEQRALLRVLSGHSHRPSDTPFQEREETEFSRKSGPSERS